MAKAARPEKSLYREIQRLRTQLQQAARTVRAVRKNQVGAIVSQTRTAKTQLVQGEAKDSCRVIVENMAEGAITTDSEGKILYCNARFAEMVSKPSNHIVGTNIVRWMAPGEQDSLQRQLASGKPRRFHRQADLVSRNGEFRRVQLSASPLRMGSSARICMVLTDMTEILAAERLSSSILQQAAEAIVVTDNRGKIIRASDATRRICGRDPINQPFNKVFKLYMAAKAGDPGTRAGRRRSRLSLSAILNGTIYLGVEVTCPRRDGLELNLIAHASPLLSTQDKILGCVVTLADITDLRRGEQARWQLASIVESTHDAIISKSLDGKILSWNPGAEQLYGYTAQEAVGEPVSLTIPPERQDEMEHMLEQINRGRKAIDLETVRIKKNGQKIYVSQTVSPILDSQGRIVGASIICRDITDRRRLEAEILRITETERQRVGHDLHDSLGQTLAGLTYMSKALQRKLNEKCLSEAADAAELQEAARVATALTRTLARGLSPVSMKADSLMSGLAELAANTTRIFKVACAFDCPQQIVIDDSVVSTHLYRIAQEAVRNAVTHGKAGNITIELSATHDAYRLAIRDDGVGLPKHREKSAGMGLRIMTYRARLLGTHLRVFSPPLAGTVVECILSKHSIEMLRLGGSQKTADHEEDGTSWPAANS